jgi:hypothetical protein
MIGIKAARTIGLNDQRVDRAHGAYQRIVDAHLWRHDLLVGIGDIAPPVAAHRAQRKCAVEIQMARHDLVIACDASHLPACQPVKLGRLRCGDIVADQAKAYGLDPHPSAPCPE